MTVQEKIIKLLIAALKKYQRVAIEGIGAFQLENVPARLDETTHTLYAPSIVVALYQTDQGDKHLISLADDVQAFAEYRLDLQKKLAADNQCQLVGFGKVIRRDGNLEFVPEQHLIDQLSHGLPRAVLTALNLEPQDDHKLPTPTTPTKIKIKEEPQTLWSHYLLPIGLLIVGILMMAWLYRSCVEHPATEPSQSEIEVESPIVHSSAADQYPYADILTAEVLAKGCQISIGSFKKVSYAKELTTQALQAGYKSKLVPFDGGVRVVIPFDCQEHDLYDYLIQIQQDVNDQAWYLNPWIDQEDLEQMR